MLKKKTPCRPPTRRFPETCFEPRRAGYLPRLTFDDSFTGVFRFCHLFDFSAVAQNSVQSLLTTGAGFFLHSCCCCAEDGTCNRAHRHCKAFRYRARRALNAASKRASGANKPGQDSSAQAKRAQAAALKAAKVQAQIVVPKDRRAMLEEAPPNDAMLALLELAKERLGDVHQKEDSSSPLASNAEVYCVDGTSSEEEGGENSPNVASRESSNTPERNLNGEVLHQWGHGRNELYEHPDAASRATTKSPLTRTHSSQMELLFETMSGMCAAVPVKDHRAQHYSADNAKQTQNMLQYPQTEHRGPLELGVASMHMSLAQHQHVGAEGSMTASMMMRRSSADGMFCPPPLSALLNAICQQQQLHPEQQVALTKRFH